MIAASRTNAMLAKEVLGLGSTAAMVSTRTHAVVDAGARRAAAAAAGGGRPDDHRGGHVGQLDAGERGAEPGEVVRACSGRSQRRSVHCGWAERERPGVPRVSAKRTLDFGRGSEQQADLALAPVIAWGGLSQVVAAAS